MIYHDTAAAVFIYQNEQGEQLGKLCYQGQGIAGELYQALMAFVEQEGLRVKPSCSYIEVKMRRSHPQWMA